MLLRLSSPRAASDASGASGSTGMGSVASGWLRNRKPSIMSTGFPPTKVGMRQNNGGVS